MKKILCFFGTRPEAIKMAPVVQHLKADKNFRVSVAVSAQHREMLDQVLRLFNVRADFDFNLMKEGQTLFDVTSGVLRRFESTLGVFKPDLVLVHGDTTTSFAGALAAFYKKIPVGHVEAGLRTRDRYQPFPEEMNRRLTDSLATLYFAPTRESQAHLHRENHSSKHIFVTGNTVIDALQSVASRQFPWSNTALARFMNSFQAKRQTLILMTAHRRENFGTPFLRILKGVKSLSQRFPECHWLYPVHPNPNVKKPAERILGRLKNIHLVDPLNYSDLVGVLKRCKIVVTDSGGLQEEAPALGKPVLVLRDVTERPEAVRAGTVKLVGTNTLKLVTHVSRLLVDQRVYRTMANAVNPYGDGKAAMRITGAIKWYFGLTKNKPSSFRA